MSEPMPQSRVLIYLFGFSVIPLILAIIHFRSQSHVLNELEERIAKLQESAYLHERKQASNLKVQSYYSDSDRFYLNKQIESISLLEKEIEALQKAGNQPYIAEDPRVSRRLATLTANTPVFSEGMVQSYSYFNEVPETLVRPIEVDTEDIKKLLARIEGVKIGPYEPGPNRPQLLITDFRLDRKTNPAESEGYTLNLKLIKREYL